MWALLLGSSSGMAFEITLAPVGARSIIAALPRRRRCRGTSWRARTIGSSLSPAAFCPGEAFYPQRRVGGPHDHSGWPVNTDLRRWRNGKMPNRRAGDERKGRVRLPCCSWLSVRLNASILSQPGLNAIDHPTQLGGSTRAPIFARLLY